jgi:hypothetical protein
MPGWPDFRMTSAVAIKGYLGVRRRSSSKRAPQRTVGGILSLNGHEMCAKIYSTRGETRGENVG